VEATPRLDQRADDDEFRAAFSGDASSPRLTLAVLR
jgi:hypothetical protein